MRIRETVPEQTREWVSELTSIGQAEDVEFAPMPRRETGTLTLAAQRVSDSVARVEAMREPHAVFWDEWNREAINAEGPLWVALGDSSTQGIGAPNPLNSWVPRILELLHERTGDPWRVINLSITGGQFTDIIEHELPRLGELEKAGHKPELATMIAGANNIMAPASWKGANGELEQILHALPRRSVVARVGVSSPFNSIMARRFTSTIERVGAQRDFELFWPWNWPSLDGMAEDKFHPNPMGYGYMTDIIWKRVCAALDV